MDWKYILKNTAATLFCEEEDNCWAIEGKYHSGLVPNGELFHESQTWKIVDELYV